MNAKITPAMKRSEESYFVNKLYLVMAMLLSMGITWHALGQTPPAPNPARPLASYNGGANLIIPVTRIREYIREFSMEIVDGDNGPKIEIHGYAPRRCLDFLKVGRVERVAESQRYETEIYARAGTAPDTFEACYQAFQAETHGLCLRNRDANDQYACQEVSSYFEQELNHQTASFTPDASGDVYLCAESPILGEEKSCVKASRHRWISAAERRASARHHQELAACESAEQGNTDAIERLRNLARDEMGDSSTRLLEIADRFAQEATERQNRERLAELERVSNLRVTTLAEAQEKLTALTRLSEALRTDREIRIRIADELMALSRAVRSIEQDNLNSDEDLDSDDFDDSSDRRVRSRASRKRETPLQFNMKRFAMIDDVLKAAQRLGNRDADLLRRQNAVERLAYAGQTPGANYDRARNQALRAIGGAVSRANQARNGDQSYARFLQDAARVTGFTAANLQNPTLAAPIDQMAYNVRTQAQARTQTAYAFQNAPATNLNMMLSPFGNQLSPQQQQWAFQQQQNAQFQQQPHPQQLQFQQQQYQQQQYQLQQYQQQQIALANQNMALSALRSPAMAFSFGQPPMQQQYLQQPFLQQPQALAYQQNMFTQSQLPAQFQLQQPQMYVPQQYQYISQPQYITQSQYYVPQMQAQQYAAPIGLGYSFDISLGFR